MIRSTTPNLYHHKIRSPPRNPLSRNQIQQLHLYPNHSPSLYLFLNEFQPGPSRDTLYRPCTCTKSIKSINTKLLKLTELGTMHVRGNGSKPLEVMAWQLKQNHEKYDKFLQALAREYKACKERENNITISKKGKQLKQPIKISGSKHGSCIEFEGTTPQDSKSRTDAARTMGRINTFAAEKRRLLSIVANDYSQTFLTKLFQCSKSTVTAARVHCIMFGRGVPPASLTFTRQCVTQEVLDGLADFLLRDNVSRPSSCRSVIIPDSAQQKYSSQLEEFTKTFWAYHQD